MAEFAFHQALCSSPASPCAVAGSSQKISSKTLSIFTHAHSLEIPDIDTDGDALMSETDLDSQDAPTFLDIGISDEFWHEVPELKIEAERVATQERGEVLDYGPCYSTKPVVIAPATTKPTPEVRPRKTKRTKRITTKQMMSTLRGEEQELGARLQAFRDRASVEATQIAAQQRRDSMPQRSQLWEQIAARQLQQRQEAEQENRRLRWMMALQVQEARSLSGVLKRRAKIQMLEDALGMKHYKEHPAVGELSSTQVFEKMLADIDLLYSRVESVFGEKGARNFEEDLRTVFIYRKVMDPKLSPGGSGSLIVRVGGHGPRPEVAWTASVSYAHRTNNNIAEYQGLLNGLRKAARMKTKGLHVVGDSAMILNQLRHRKLPRARHLQNYYTQCRLLADHLMVLTWSHHLRHFNKAADCIANLAMDTKTSIRIFEEDVRTLPARWTPVIELLHGDIAHWMDMHPDQEEDSRTSTNTGAV